VRSHALQKLLDDVRGKEEENVINEVAIRSMAKAVYAVENIGHFGLGFKHYTHFTSPIRRYPDLIVHRLLHEYEKKLTAKRLEEIRGLLPDICKQSSDRERVAMEAERASSKVMKVEYMKRHIGEEFDAIISGVTNYGLFVEITDLLVEGLIRVRDMEDDYYVFDEKKFQMVGKRTKKRYRLGDKVKIRVVRVNPEERQIDFSLVR
jgi:ribonuclease R